MSYLFVDSIILVGSAGITINSKKVSKYSWGGGRLCGFPALNGEDAVNSAEKSGSVVFSVEYLSAADYSVASLISKDSNNDRLWITSLATGSSFRDFETSCAMNGGKLASIHSQYDNNRIAAMCGNTKCLLGLTNFPPGRLFKTGRVFLVKLNLK